MRWQLRRVFRIRVYDLVAIKIFSKDIFVPKKMNGLYGSVLFQRHCAS
jgi:hypothetical protein